MNKEVSHFVVTAHPPGSVLVTCKCNFMSPQSKDVLVAKSRRLEVRQLRSSSNSNSNGSDDGAAIQTSPFPIVSQVPINGRITNMAAFSVPSIPTSLVFFLTDRFRYAAVSSFESSSLPPTAVPPPYPMTTHASGSLRGQDDSNMQSQVVLGRPAESGPLVTADLYSRCIALHLYNGLITIIPINTNYTAQAQKSAMDDANNRRPSNQVLMPAFHCRIEEQTILAMSFLLTDMDSMPQLCILHQGGARGGEQHITSMLVNLESRQLHLHGSQSAPPTTQWMQRKSMVDGGSSLLVPVPPLNRLSSPAAATTAQSAQANQRQSKKEKNATGGVIIVGQQQFTYCSPTVTKVLPFRQALFLTADELPADPSTGMPRYLLGDEFGNLHMLTLMIVNEKVVAMQRDALGSTATLASSLDYLEQGLVFCGSTWGDSQLVQIHDEALPDPEVDGRDMVHDADAMDEENEDENDSNKKQPMNNTTFLSVVEEYTQLGPILDFDLIPTTLGGGDNRGGGGIQQSQVVTASGSSQSGTLRLIRNGIGMNEYAAVEIPGIQNMWSVRKTFQAAEDAYLVQSFVGETRVLGATAVDDEELPSEQGNDSEEEAGGTLAEVELPGLESQASTLYLGNLSPSDRLIQITESQVRLFSPGLVLDIWESGQPITVATANEAGQVAIALQGGLLVHLQVGSDEKWQKVAETQMDKEISCLDLHPLNPENAMDTGEDDENKEAKRSAISSELLAVGLWDDFTVRLLSLETGNLEEALCIYLTPEEDSEEDAQQSIEDGPSRRSRNNMMARSLSLITLDLSSSNSSHANSSSGTGYLGVDMLFVGMGDGTLISFAVTKKKGVISVHSKKEVCLGTQRIDLVPLNTEQGGTCILATGDRPTVVYLAGLGGTSSNQSNPKLCYSNVNLAANDEDDGDEVNRVSSQQCIAVNVATPFFSPLLFDTSALGSQHYSLCVADDSNLRLGVIDDIQKLHVTTCRLGMAPRRIVHCPEGRLFAVGCMESGIKHFGMNDDESNMGNCIRIMDDTNFDDLERIDLEPFEIILSMTYVNLEVTTPVESNTAASEQKPFLLVGTAYAMPNEDEPTRGRILVYTCQGDEINATANDSRAIRQVTELSTKGGVYSLAQFYDGLLLCTVNSKTMVCQLVEDAGVFRLEFLGRGHHGNILSLFVKSRAKRMSLEDGVDIQPASLVMDVSDDAEKAQDSSHGTEEEKIAIVGDLMRSISLVQYYPEHKTLEEVARDFNSNWTTAIEMLHEDVYLGAENWNNLFCLRRNRASTSEEVRCRLDTIGEFHLGEMCNKFMNGSLVMPNSSSSKPSSAAVSSNLSRSSGARSPSPKKKKSSSTESPGTGKAAASRTRRPHVVIGSQTLFGTVDGSLGCILGLDGKTANFFGCLERAMAKVIRPVGDLDHRLFRAVEAERRVHPSHGFVDGDLVESFLDLDHSHMEGVVREMNRDGGWEVDDDDPMAARDAEEKDGTAGSPTDRAMLSVDEVVAMVEEMTMLH